MLIIGVEKIFPVTNEVPPEDTSNQFTVPTEAVASRITTPESQREAGVVEVIGGGTTTVAVIGVLDKLVQPFALASA